MNTLHDKALPVALVECPMCHWRLPEAELTSFLGRRVCVGCAGAWFDLDEAEDVDHEAEDGERK